MKGLLNDVLQSGQLLIFIDEAHLHLDTDEGYGWTVEGERAWVSSSSPGLRKASFYGVYIYNLGQVRIFPYEKAEKFNTIDVLKKLRTEFSEQEMTVIWDGASYHRAGIVKEAAGVLDISLQRLNPVYVENSSFCPHPKSLSQDGRGILKLAPLLPSWEKGLGDEGQQIQTTSFKLDGVY